MSASDVRARRWIRAGLLALILGAILVWLAWPEGSEPVAAPVSGGFAPPEILRPRPPDAGLGEAFAVEFDETGHLRALALDGGLSAETARARGFRHHVTIDLCDEPLPGELTPPAGSAVVTHEGLRVAHDPSKVPRREARAIAVEASAALEDAAALLGAPPREHLLVVTHASREALNEALGGPGWAIGSYDGAVHVVAGEHAQSLRHEVMHAQLHASAPCVPYWLDEGLAARFEHDAARRSFEWLRMVHGHVWIPLSSLVEPLEDDEGAELMARDEVALLYAQVLAMVWMLEDRGGPGAIARAVRAASDGMPRSMIWDTSMPDRGGEDLLDYLASRLFPDVPPEARPALAGRPYSCRARGDDAPVCEPRR